MAGGAPQALEAQGEDLQRFDGPHRTQAHGGVAAGPAVQLADLAVVEAFLDSDSGVDEVAAELEEAREHGITAVPTYVFNGMWAVPGAQDPDTFATVLRKMAATALTAAST